MKTIYIPFQTDSKTHLNLQFEDKETCIGDYKFVIGGPCEEADYVVVLEYQHDEFSIKVNPSNLILFTGEPPTIKRYPKKYLDQFKHIYTCHEKLATKARVHITYPTLPWFLACDFSVDDKNRNFNYFKEVPHEGRLNKICLFTSNKKFCKGHCDRIHFAEEIKRRLPNLIDIYGVGYNEVDCKIDVLSKYKYSIVIENSSYPNYWTEKLADTLLAETVPLYYGDPLIHNLFTEEEVPDLDIFNVDEAVEKVTALLKSNYYEEHQDSIKRAKQKVLYDYNMFPRIVSFISLLPAEAGEKRGITIYPQKFSRFTSYMNAIPKYLCQHLPYSIIKRIM